MLTMPRTGPVLTGLRGMTTIFLHLGKFQPAEVGNFRPTQTGEFSTGADRRIGLGHCALYIIGAPVTRFWPQCEIQETYATWNPSST